MASYSKALLQKYFEDQSVVGASIESFNHFVEKELPAILEENKDIEPTIIPAQHEEHKIRFDRIWTEHPKITEADGSERKIFPIEARLRKLTYSSPVFIEVSSHINKVQKETVKTQIGNLPIMLKSKSCNLYKASTQELIERGEDPYDPGGYFIINGTEKVLINVEDLAANKMLIERGTSDYQGRLFSERGSYKIPHVLERGKDGIFYLSFTRVKKIPAIVLVKALGLLKDEEIMRFVSAERQFGEVLINLYEFIDIKTQEDAIDWIAKRIGITQAKEVRLERTQEILDKYLLPHLGIRREDRVFKAYNLCKMMKRYILVALGELDVDDKDHYMNKRLKTPGDLLADLFRVNIKVLINDLLYNFQRIVKRGKIPTIKVIIRDKLLTSRIYSSMATGSWVGGRKGISQRIQRLNFLETVSHLQRVVSPLSASQENFEARELHPTHLGRLCPIETPEGTNIGLRKNLSLLASVSQEVNEDEVVRSLRNLGLKVIR
ncbi:DNA-directed RNA polymerase subunit B'' [Candidatus Woesearchaeota archaeon]|nr:DNA-directed RNA polymerase subunit B'' [Candidatus Woesearchaeota archaeon]